MIICSGLGGSCVAKTKGYYKYNPVDRETPVPVGKQLNELDQNRPQQRVSGPEGLEPSASRLVDHAFHSLYSSLQDIGVSKWLWWRNAINVFLWHLKGTINERRGSRTTSI